MEKSWVLHDPQERSDLPHSFSGPARRPRALAKGSRLVGKRVKSLENAGSQGGVRNLQISDTTHFTTKIRDLRQKGTLRKQWKNLGLCTIPTERPGNSREAVKISISTHPYPYT